MKTTRRIFIKDEDIIRRVERDMKLDRENTQTLREKLKDWHKMYMGEPEIPLVSSKDQADDSGTQFNVSVPITAMAVNTFHPRIVMAMLQQKDFVVFSPTEVNDVEKVKKLNLWFPWVLFNHVKGFFDWTDKGAQIAAIEGQWFNSVNWIRQERTVRSPYGPYPTMNQQTGMGVTAEDIIYQIFGFEAKPDKVLIDIEAKEEDYYKVTYKTRVPAHPTPFWREDTAFVDLFLDEETQEITALVEEKRVIYQGPKLECENIDYLYFPEDVKSLQPGDCPHVIVKYDLPLSEVRSLREQRKLKFSNETWEDIVAFADSQTTEAKQTGEMATQKMESLGIDAQRRSEDEIVHLADCYYSWDANKDQMCEEMIFTVAYRDSAQVETPYAVLRKCYLDEEILTGDRPTDVVPFDIRPYSLFGRGLCEKNKGIQEVFDDLINQMLNVTDLTMFPWGFYQQSVGGVMKQQQKIKLKRGQWLPVEDVNGLFVPNFQNNIAGGAQLAQMFWSMHERNTAMNDQMLGRQGAAKTATATVRLLGEAMQQMALPYRRFAEGIKRRLLAIYQLYRVYMPPEMQYRIMGPDGEWQFHAVTRDELVMHPDINVNLDIESTNKVFQREIYGMLLQAITLNPVLLQMGIVDQGTAYTAAKNYVQAFVPNEKDYIREPPNAEQMIPPEQENAMFAQGGISHPKQGEDHQTHIMTHMMFAQNPPPELMMVRERFQALQLHIQEHQQMWQQMQMLMQAAMAQNPMQNLLGEGGGEFTAQAKPNMIQGDITAASGRGLQGMGGTQMMGGPGGNGSI